MGEREDGERREEQPKKKLRDMRQILEDRQHWTPSDERAPADTGAENRPEGEPGDHEEREDWTSADAAGSETGGFPGEERDICPDEDAKPGDLTDEMVSEDRHPPGTVDDVPYSLDEDRPEQKPPLEPRGSGSEEADLWREMEQLDDEDRKAGYHVEDIPAEELPDVEEAIGEDASEEASGENVGTSDRTEREHGGFPERKR